MSDADALDRTAVFINARNAPSRPDRDANKAQLHREVDETFRTLGEQMGGDVDLQASGFCPGRRGHEISRPGRDRRRRVRPARAPLL
jgi:hypothetical protein